MPAQKRKSSAKKTVKKSVSRVKSSSKPLLCFGKECSNKYHHRTFLIIIALIVFTATIAKLLFVMVDNSSEVVDNLKAFNLKENVTSQTQAVPEVYVASVEESVNTRVLPTKKPTPTKKPKPTITPLPTPTPTPTPAAKRVFVTSTYYNGNLGGLSGADTKCQERANAANLGGTWKAWISYGSDSASSRLTHSTTPYTRVDNMVIANNWDDLVDGTLQNSISINEYGTSIAGPMTIMSVWTNTSYQGSSYGSDYTCGGFTNSNSGGVYSFGQAGSTSSWWTSISGNAACSNQMRLYCFEQ